MRKRKKPTPTTLLQGMPYTPAVKTNILDTFRKLGYVPPSESRGNSLTQQPPFQ